MWHQTGLTAFPAPQWVMITVTEPCGAFSRAHAHNGEDKIPGRLENNDWDCVLRLSTGFFLLLFFFLITPLNHHVSIYFSVSSQVFFPFAPSPPLPHSPNISAAAFRYFVGLIFVILWHFDILMVWLLLKDVGSWLFTAEKPISTGQVGEKEKVSLFQQLALGGDGDGH